MGIHGVLARRGETNNRLTHKIIQGLAASGQVDKSLAMLKNAEASDFTAPPRMMDEIMASLIAAGKLDECVELYRRQRDNGSVLFCSTFMSMLSGLTRAGRKELTMDLLTEPKAKLVNTQNIGNTIPFLDVFCQAGDAENLRQVFDVLAKEGFIDNDDARSFAKLVEVHLVRHDTAAAVAEFERIYHEHKKIAHKFSLMERLIEEEDLEQMQKVLDLSIEVHGEEKSLYDLAHNFLAGGKKSQAKKLLETPGLRYNHSKMKYIIDRLLGEANKDGVEDLVMLSKNVFGCDRDYLFSRLVKAHDDNGDKVQEIWINIQEEGHAPSDSLKRQIADILQAHGRQVPFEIPVEYQHSKVEKDEERNIAKPKERTVTQTTEVSKPEKTRRIGEEESNIVLAKAVSSGNFDEIMAAINADPGPTKKGKLAALNSLTEAGKLAEACEVAISINRFRERDGGTSAFQQLLGKLKEADRTDLMKVLEEGLSGKTNRVFTLQMWIRGTTVLHRPEEYLDIVRTSTLEDRSWYLPNSAVAVALEKNTGLEQGLEGLVKEGSDPAAVILGRQALVNMDKEAFVKNCGLIKDKEKGLVEIVQGNGAVKENDVLAWARERLEEVEAPKDAFKAMYRMAMTMRRRNPKELGNVANEALKWIALEDIDASLLKVLCEKVPDFPHKSEAIKIIEERKSA